MTNRLSAARLRPIKNSCWPSSHRMRHAPARIRCIRRDCGSAAAQPGTPSATPRATG